MARPRPDRQCHVVEVGLTHGKDGYRAFTIWTGPLWLAFAIRWLEGLDEFLGHRPCQFQRMERLLDRYAYQRDYPITVEDAERFRTHMGWTPHGEDLY